MNGAGFEISKEDLALGPGTRLDHSRAFVKQSFIKVKKGQRKLLTQTQKGGGERPSLVLARELYAFLTGYYSKSKECLRVVKILLDPLP